MVSRVRTRSKSEPQPWTVLNSSGRRLRRRAEEQLAADRVLFRGILDHEAVLSCLSTQQVFIFPTRWEGEGHSNAVNEAMQIGLPIVTTRQGFLADVVTEECGAVLPSPEPEALARAIAELRGDWQRLRACGAAAHARVYREFSDAAALPRLAGLYASLLERADSRGSPG